MNSREKLFHRAEILPLAGLVVLAAALRLIDVAQPYVDEWSYKQGTIAMIAENFYRNSFDLFYPQINWAGPVPGYIGTEFPLVPFLAALLYVPFGVQEWIGRSVSVLFFTASVPFFYLLVRKISNRRSALFAAAVYTLIPLGVFAGRSFISDTTSLGFAVAALYLFSEWLDRPEDLKLMAAAALTTALAILVKLPAIILGLPLLYMAWERHGTGVWRQPKVWAFAALALIFPAAWYAHAYLITLSYPPHQFAGSDGIALAEPSFYAFIARRLATSSLTPLVTAGMLTGLFLPVTGKYGRVFHWWLAAICLFIVVAGNGNRHPWYQLSMVPVAAAFAGRAFDLALGKLKTITRSSRVEWGAGVALFGALAVTSYIYIKPLYDPWAMPLWTAGHEIERITSPDALGVFVVDGDSSGIYYSRRKGWHAMDSSTWGQPADSGEAIAKLEQLRSQGAGFLVFTRYTVWWLDYYREFQKYLDSRYRREAQNDDYVIFDLSGGDSRRVALATAVSRCDREVDCAQKSR
ncbi:MAG TPA: glycosyltransferase family 39 protein [Candidatus Binatia bacterium]|jgi:4-amino-4-deoxy-L-arabinose transferase-like glycosyltransferase